MAIDVSTIIDMAFADKHADKWKNGAHAPSLPMFQTGMPSRRALSARLAWMPLPGVTSTPIGNASSMASLRLKGAAFASCPIGLEDDLRHLAVIGPARRDAFGAFRAAAVQEHHVGVLGVDLVELVPDQMVIIEVEAAAEGDLRARRKHHLGLGPAFRGDEVSAVDHRCRHRAMADLRSAARLPV